MRCQVGAVGAPRTVDDYEANAGAVLSALRAGAPDVAPRGLSPSEACSGAPGPMREVLGAFEALMERQRRAHDAEGAASGEQSPRWGSGGLRTPDGGAAGPSTPRMLERSPSPLPQLVASGGDGAARGDAVFVRLDDDDDAGMGERGAAPAAWERAVAAAPVRAQPPAAAAAGGGEGGYVAQYRAARAASPMPPAVGVPAPAPSWGGSGDGGTHGRIASGGDGGMQNRIAGGGNIAAELRERIAAIEASLPRWHELFPADAPQGGSPQESAGGARVPPGAGELGNGVGGGRRGSGTSDSGSGDGGGARAGRLSGGSSGSSSSGGGTPLQLARARATKPVLPGTPPLLGAPPPPASRGGGHSEQLHASVRGPVPRAGSYGAAVVDADFGALIAGLRRAGDGLAALG